jgi:RNase adapter protein RapZ
MASNEPGTGASHATHIVIVTGVSGAGKSTALRSLEDQGYFCVDNLPTILAPEVVEVCAQGGITRVALGIDVRALSFLGAIATALDALAKRPGSFDVLYCDASDEAILRRFSETRRPHALASEGTGAFAVLDGVRIERERLAPLKARATSVIDTTHLSVHDLRRRVFEQFSGPQGVTKRMAVRFVSFGFKYGAPVDADLIFDVRFLSNPYFVKALKPLSGLSEEVRSFVLSIPDAQEFLGHIEKLLAFVIPKYALEGKSYLTIGIGCTGGRHRSVVVTEELSRRFGSALLHRDLEREGAQDANTTGRFSVTNELKLELSPLPAAAELRSKKAPGTP